MSGFRTVTVPHSTQHTAWGQGLAPQGAVSWQEEVSSARRRKGKHNNNEVSSPNRA